MADEIEVEGPRKPAGRPSKARGAPHSSDAADARWTVRGVPVNVRGMATKAAERKGMTVGDWLAEAIVSYSRADKLGVSADSDHIPADGGANLPAVQLPPEFNAALDVLRQVQERLDKLEATRQTPKPRFRLFGGRG